MNIKTLKFANKIQGWLSAEEGLFLEQTVRSIKNLKGVIVEIGSFKGKSTIFLAQGKKGVYAIDPHNGVIKPHVKFPNTYKEFRRNLKNAGIMKKVVPIVKTSMSTSKNWNKKISFLFIDGLHDETNATNDFELWSKHVVDGGIVAMHDSFMRWGGSEKVAIRKIVNSSEFYKIGVKGCIIYGIKGKGNFVQKIEKLFLRFFILSATYLNRGIKTLQNLSTITRSKSFIGSVRSID